MKNLARTGNEKSAANLRVRMADVSERDATKNALDGLVWSLSHEVQRAPAASKVRKRPDRHESFTIFSRGSPWHVYSHTQPRKTHRTVLLFGVPEGGRPRHFSLIVAIVDGHCGLALPLETVGPEWPI